MDMSAKAPDIDLLFVLRIICFKGDKFTEVFMITVFATAGALEVVVTRFPPIIDVLTDTVNVVVLCTGTDALADADTNMWAATTTVVEFVLMLLSSKAA